MAKQYGINIYPRSDNSKYMRERSLRRKHPEISDEEIVERITAQEKWRRKEMAKPNSRMRFRKLVDQARWRAKRDDVPFDISINNVIELFTEGDLCPILNVPMYFNFGGKRAADNSPSIDKIIPSKGYILDNIAIISWRANRIKCDATFEELSSIVKWLKQQRAYS